MMNSGAQTPEDIETLFEDTLVIRDYQGLAQLFEDGAVLIVDDEQSARGAEAIARLALMTWADRHIYIADPHCVIQARDIALVVCAQGINVVRRGSDGFWRYAIVCQLVSDELVLSNSKGDQNDTE
ncbi:MAG: hypothetical protein HC804_00555 [Anaerolineae bacterium]|nr:hypothetical protein [Anaerolineae bacterium]